MHKAARFTLADGVGDGSGGEGGGEGQIAAGQGLTETENIGGDGGVIAGEQGAATAKAGGDLIGDQQYPVATTGLAYALQVARVIEAHAASALNQRFEDHGGDLLVVGRQQAGEGDEVRLIPVVVEGALRRRGEQVLRQVAVIQAVHAVMRIAHRHGTEGIAVVAVA